MLRPDCRLDTAEIMGGEHPLLDGLNRPGIPRIIPESIKASQVKISTIDEEAEDLMKDRLKRKPLAAFRRNANQ